MSVPNVFTPSTAIASSQVNANFTDFAAEVTNSLPRDGQAGMTGVMKVIDGASAAAPGFAFANDPNTGLRRSADNTMQLVADGTDVVQVTPGGVAIPGALTVGGNPITSITNATSVPFTPSGGIAATNVGAALVELDTEKSATGHNHDASYYTETELNAGQLNNLYFTESESNTRFLQGVRLSTEASTTFGSNVTVNAPAGNVVTGLKIIDDSFGPTDWILYYKPVQQNINGSWATVSG